MTGAEALRAVLDLCRQEERACRAAAQTATSAVMRHRMIGKESEARKIAVTVTLLINGLDDDEG